MNIFNVIWEFKYYLLLILFFKFSINLIYWYQTSNLHNEYFNWLADNKTYFAIAQKKHLFKNLVKKSNITDAHIPTTQFVGYGRIVEFNASVAENFPSRLSDFATVTINMFCEMEGVFKGRALETFNPFYWINSVIYLPKNILEFLGLSSTNVATKLIQLIWWAIGIAGTIILELYPEYLRQLINSFLPILP